MWAVAVTQALSETSATHLQAWALRCPQFAVVGAAACNRQGHALLWGPRVGNVASCISSSGLWTPGVMSTDGGLEFSGAFAAEPTSRGIAQNTTDGANSLAVVHFRFPAPRPHSLNLFTCFGQNPQPSFWHCRAQNDEAKRQSRREHRSLLSNASAGNRSTPGHIDGKDVLYH